MEREDVKLYASCTVPAVMKRRVRPRKTQIATWELVAALAGLWALLDDPVCSGSEILLLVDSAVALGTLLRGASRQSDWNDLVSEI